MPIETEIWRIEKDLNPLSLTGIDLEKRLEEIISAKLSILAPGLMQIGRQVPTAFGGYIDILAIDAVGNLVVVKAVGNLVVVKLKKGKAMRPS